MQLYIIYTETAMLITRHQYDSWREIQDAYASYKASLGPWSVDEVVEYLEGEHGGLLPSAKAQVDSFLLGDCETQVLSFEDK